MVIVGVFLATLLEKYFQRYESMYPKNPITAFIYASIIPVCACTVIPMMGTMQGKINLRTIITFIVVAPLLSPYIIMLSFSVLGFEYGILKIICSLILAVITSIVMLFRFLEKKLTLILLLNIATVSLILGHVINTFYM